MWLLYYVSISMQTIRLQNKVKCCFFHSLQWSHPIFHWTADIANDQLTYCFILGHEAKENLSSGARRTANKKLAELHDTSPLYPKLKIQKLKSVLNLSGQLFLKAWPPKCEVYSEHSKESVTWLNLKLSKGIIELIIHLPHLGVYL